MDILIKSGKYVAFAAIGLLAAFTGNQRTVALTTVDDPDNHLTTDFDGVARLFGPERYTCGASLLGTGKHLLTAGHCAYDYEEEEFYELSEIFLDIGLNELLNPSDFIIHPEFDPWTLDNDIAIIELGQKLPGNISQYDIYRDSDEFGKVGEKVGYGGHATGDEGVSGEDPADFDSLKRVGQNTYDAGGEILNQFLPLFDDIISGTTLAYDFDNGDKQNDAFGKVFGLDHLGLGVNEVNSVFGDSGGPTFIDGLIAGLTSYGFGGDFMSRLKVTDVTNNITDSSFGEISVDTRVSYYADWIDMVIGNSSGSINNGVNQLGVPTATNNTKSRFARSHVTTVPEPSALVGLLSVVGAGLVLKRKKRDRSCK